MLDNFRNFMQSFLGMNNNQNRNRGYQNRYRGSMNYKLIPFESEFRHIETFIALEKIRFNDRINTYFDIKAKDFFVPPLSLQPIVENAIKHGILNRIEGGTLTIRTFETDDAYVVRIIDDGVGFDINSVDFKNNTHIGINNIKSRLNTMCNAEIKLESEPGQGTEVRVTFYK